MMSYTILGLLSNGKCVIFLFDKKYTLTKCCTSYSKCLMFVKALHIEGVQ